MLSKLSTPSRNVEKISVAHRYRNLKADPFPVQVVEVPAAPVPKKKQVAAASAKPTKPRRVDAVILEAE
jgi:hypothetical protein